MEHEWEDFTEDLVICSKCGNTCDETADKDQWEAECFPDPVLTGGQ